MSILVDDNGVFSLMSVVSICVVLVDCDESNNVKFVSINICDKCVKHCMHIISHSIYIALFLKSYIFIICIHIYSYIYFLVGCVYFD